MEYIGNAFPYTKIKDLGITIKKNDVWNVPQHVPSKDLAIALKNKWILSFDRKKVRPDILATIKIYNFQPYEYKQKQPVPTPNVNEKQDVNKAIANLTNDIVDKLTPLIPKQKGLSREDVIQLMHEMTSEKPKEIEKGPGITKKDIQSVFKTTMAEMKEELMLDLLNKNLSENPKNTYNNKEEIDAAPMFIPTVETESTDVKITTKEAVDKNGLEDQLKALKNLRRKND